MPAIIVRSPRSITTMERPLSLFDELAEELWSSWPFTRMPFRVDMIEDKDELIVKAELPGVSKDSLDISIDGDMLTIKAEKKLEEFSEDATYYTCERSFGKLTRTLTLPFPVDASKASSTFEDGVLEIRLPKSEEAKAMHIEVQPK